MHRFSSYLCLLLAAALYVSVSGCATPPSQPPVKPRVQAPVPVATPSPVDQPAQLEPLLQAQPLPQVEVQPLILAEPPAPLSSEKPVDHIALLLPLKSAAFERAADAVRQGFLAAAGSQRQILPIKVYGSVDESKDIVALYQLAIAGGAVAVAGPLTRDGVAALANYPGIVVPTLALNVIENKDAGQLYFFGLSAEAEARQIAQLAAAAKLRYATIVSTGTPLSKRLSLAFANEWKALGGSITEEILYNDDPAALALLPTAPGDAAPAPVATKSGNPLFSKLNVELTPPPALSPDNVDPNFIPPPTIAPGNMVFLAAEIEKARVIRPYLNAALPVYATSQLFNNNADTLTNYDLNDLHFVGMPWLLQPDHPAVMIYPRASLPLEPDMERLYALGIDAFRLLHIMLSNSYRTSLPLDGVTGRIRLSNNQFQRDAIPAQIKQGRSQVVETLLKKSPSR